MSAREELIQAAAERWIDGGLDPSNLVEAEKLVDAFAHELAEKIRRELPESVEYLDDGFAEIHTVPSARQAADLIDPMKEQDRGQQ